MPLVFPTPQFDSLAAQSLFWVLILLAGGLVGWLGFVLGRAIGRAGTGRKLADREAELFTAQKGFRKLYEGDINDLKQLSTQLQAENTKLKEKVEDSRKKAAGFGGLFGGSSTKRADAMYALLLENEALEQALFQQNAKLQQTQGDSVKEAIRQAGYRRVLLGQLMADDRVKGVVSEILGDDRRLPGRVEE